MTIGGFAKANYSAVVVSSSGLFSDIEIKHSFSYFISVLPSGID